MSIERSRSYYYKNPSLPAVKKWLSAKLISELDKATTSLAREKAIFRFSDVSDESIWVEYVLSPVELSGQFLTCFSVIDKGYGVADARMDYVTLQDVITYFKIPIIEVANYALLFQQIKNNARKGLYKVTSGSGKYGLIVDNRLSTPERYDQIINALNGVNFDVTVNYTGETISLAKPNIGEIALSWPGFRSVTLEVYPLEEIEMME